MGEGTETANILSDGQIRVLVLNNGEHQDGTLYRMRKGIRFKYLISRKNTSFFPDNFNKWFGISKLVH